MLIIGRVFDEVEQERLAELAYYRERADEAAADAEHEVGEVEYHALAWECLSDFAKRPYRTAVATVCDVLAFGGC